jgi:hypothetical protein
LQQGCNSLVSSAIATMLSIRTPKVASHTHPYLVRSGPQEIEPSDNRAVPRLRDDTNITVDRWASFIHFSI